MRPATEKYDVQYFTVAGRFFVNLYARSLLTYMRGPCEPMCEVLFLYILQDIEDMIPYHLYGGNV